MCVVGVNIPFQLDTFGQTESAALDMLRQVLPPNAVLVGMNIRMDIEWLGLVEGRDYAACIDLADLFRVYNLEKRSFTYFSLDHVVGVIG
jgi:RNA exonuclease 4